MAYRVEAATPEDIGDIAAIRIRALSDDDFWCTAKGSIPYEEELEWTITETLPRLGLGYELGACQIWKVVDEDGKMLGWAGLRIPCSLSEEENAKLKTSIAFPGQYRNEGLANFFKNKVLGSLEGRYDHTRDCNRQQTMVDPAHQRKGVGRLLTQKCSKEADSRGAVTWVRARPKAASLFLKEGFEVVERINLDLAEHGAKGTTSFFVMKREPGARNDPSRKLDLE